MRILFLTQIFDPEPAIKGISFVKAISDAGHDVKVVTGFPNYPGGAVYPGYRIMPWKRQVQNGVEIVRLAHCPSHNSSSLRRAWHFVSFGLSAMLYVLMNGWRFDLVYVGHPGVTTGLAALVGGWPWRLKYVVDVQDLWPESLTASRLRGSSRMAKVARPICDLVYRRASGVVAQSKGMADCLAERGVQRDRLVTIYNWVNNLPEAQPLKNERTDRKYIFAYTGNFGPLQALDTVVSAARLANRENPAIELWLIGTGVEEANLKQVAGEDLGRCIKFFPRMPQGELVAKLADVAAMVLNLADAAFLDVTIPSKTQFYLALGKPVLAGAKGELADILSGSKAAVVVPPEQPEAMGKAMVELSQLRPEIINAMGQQGRDYFERHFSFQRAIGLTVDAIKAFSRKQQT